MSHSVLSSFDPLATHPFTNNSGLLPKPAPPSQFPHPNPSPVKAHQSISAYGPALPLPSVQSPKPRRPQPAKAGAPQPIFVPFRPERTTPDLDDILLRKRVADVFTGKNNWGIDRVPMPLPATGGRKQ